MGRFFLLSLSFFSMMIASAQPAQGDLAITLGAVTTPNFGNQGIGFDLSARYYFTDAFSAGGNFYFAKTRFNYGFGYDTDRTLINKYSISVPFQYDVVQTKNFSLGFGFSIGVLINELRDRNQTTEEAYWDSSLGIGVAWQAPVFLKSDTFFTGTPFTEASYKLLPVDTKDPTFLFLTAKLGYQNVFGNGSFSKATDFSDMVFSIGLTIKGPTN